MIKKTGEYEQNFRMIKVLLASLPLFFCVIAMLFPEHAFAQKEDALRVQATAIEDFLTGNIMRGVAVTGNIWGLIQSYMKSSALILSSVIGIDLMGWGMLAWVKTTWAYVI